LREKYTGFGYEIRMKESSRWDSNIKMDMREVGWSDMDWVYLTQYRDQWRGILNKIMNFQILLNAKKFK
jgi:hypothetical protein